MQKIVKLTLAAVLVLALVMTGATVLAQSETQLRFVHALVDAPNVDIYINDTLAAEDVTYGTASEFIDTVAGDLNIQVTATGDSTPLFEQIVTASTEPQTLIISEADGFTAYTENVDPLNVGQARLTAVHAISGGPAVDVLLVDGRPVITGLEYGVPYGTLDVPVFNFALNVAPTGEGLASAIFAEAFEAPLATGTAYTAVVYGTLDAPQVMLLDAVTNPNPGDGFLQITHDVTDGSAVDIYANDTLVVPGLAYGANTVSFAVPAGEYNVQLTEANTVNILGGDSITITENANTTVTATADDSGLVLVAETEAGEAPAQSEVVVAPTESTSAASEVVAAPAVTPQPAQEVVVAQPTQAPSVPASTALPTARVNLDPGANLQLRQYPNSEALSLGLAPAGAVMNVLGREGAPVQIEGLFSQEIQDQIDAFVDPAEGIDPKADIAPETTWLKVQYTTTDGGAIEAWVLSSFLEVTNIEGEPQRLAELDMVPNNAFGEAANTAVTPPPLPDNIVTAVVYNLNPGVNLQIRRTPDTFGESLGLVPNGTALEYLGFAIDDTQMPDVTTAEAAEWVYVRYIPAEGGDITGWVSTTYIEFYYRGDTIDFEEMDARTLLLFEDISTRGELGSGAVAPSRPTVDPLKDTYIATVVVDANANLQFRRTPDSFGESLGLVPSGTQLVVTARDTTGEWLLVTFEGQEGWIASDFIRLTFNGRAVELDELLIEAGN